MIKLQVVSDTEERLNEDNCCCFFKFNLIFNSECLCAFFSPGGGVPNLTRRGGSEVCVVISGQHQGQVYLCDTANLGSSAHSRHHVSEGCPGRTGQIKIF